LIKKFNRQGREEREDFKKIFFATFAPLAVQKA
jgi:hypothetical protein